ncbi:hypothetical protein [Plantactinospora soyae]|uniref:Uncharacterized protein n=1 Tax=Plantactinospora soyae TaxID=1544732 RepID=A0A927MA68_9ACTN|nr:hypothetical protein [Plantactinospora soyae]MBE1490779.1 hypothetical protein [Plantactinospora soyae]
MKLNRTQIFGLSWIGFSLFFVFLQYLFNDTTSGFAIFLSAVAAIPVAALLAYRARRARQR